MYEQSDYQTLINRLSVSMTWLFFLLSVGYSSRVLPTSSQPFLPSWLRRRSQVAQSAKSTRYSNFFIA